MLKSKKQKIFIAQQGTQAFIYEGSFVSSEINRFEFVKYLTEIFK